MEVRHRCANGSFVEDVEDGAGVGVVVVWKGEISGRYASVDAQRRKRWMSSLQIEGSNDQPKAADETHKCAN